VTPRVIFGTAIALLFFVALAACGKKEEAAAPPAAEISADSIAHFCNMAVSEHAGPKGQIFVAGRAEPFWFASVRDTFAFTMLPEEPKDVTAIYVTDMAKAKNWDQPGPGTWVEARKAVFVIDSRKKSGMGEAEAVPFSDEAAAQTFMAEYGGRLVRFDEMPRDYILPKGDVAPGGAMDMDKGAPPQNSGGQMHDNR
jgi:copper chaperone NosL